MVSETRRLRIDLQKLQQRRSSTGGTSTGSVTGVSVVTANGISGSVANSTTTPAITLTIGAITPSSVAASGTVTGSNLSGTNTGDQTTISGNAGTATTLATSRNFSIAGSGITAAAVGFNGSAAVVLAASVDAGHITLARMADVATATVFYRKTAGTGVPEVQTLATLKTDLGLTGTNSGDQTTIVGITGTKAQFDTAVTDGNILYVGDVTQYTDELAQDAVGAMVDASLTYVDGTPLLQRAALTGAVTATAGSNATSLGSFTTAQLNTALSDADIATAADLATKQPLDTQLTDLAALSYAGNTLKVVRVNAGETAFELATPSGGGGGTTITSGVTTIDFGAFPGKSDVSLDITGQASIVSGSKVKAYIIATATADHSADEHWLETIDVMAGNIVAATGFTIYAKNTNWLAEPVLEQWANTRLAGPGTGTNQIRPDNGGGKGTRLYGLFTIAWEWY